MQLLHKSAGAEDSAPAGISPESMLACEIVGTIVLACRDSLIQVVQSIRLFVAGQNYSFPHGERAVLDVLIFFFFLFFRCPIVIN